MIHPVVRDLFLDLGRHPGYQDVLHRVSAGENASLSGLTTTAKALYAVLLWQSAGRPLIIVVDGNKQAEALSEAVQTFFSLLVAEDKFGPQLLPALDVLPMQNLSPHAEICEQRAIGLWSLATKRSPITVMPVASALLKIEPGDFYRQLALRLRVGEELPLEEVVAHLESIGYERREPVEMVGEYSVRGGILDVFPPEAQKPVRVDLFGDQVESIRRFDVESQRSVLKVEDCLLLPLTEYQRSRRFLAELNELMQEADIPGRDLPPPGETFPGWELIAPMLKPRNSSVFSLVDKPAVIWDEPEQVIGAAKRLWTRLEQIERSVAYDPDRIFFRWEDLEKQAGKGPQVKFQQIDIGWSASGEATSAHVPTRPSMTFHGNIQVAIAEARTLVESGQKVAFFASATGELERMADILNEYGIAYQLGLEQSESTPAYLAQRAYMSGASASIYLVKGLIRHGTAFPDSKLVVFGSEDLFETSELVSRGPSSKTARETFSADIIDLKPGDYVVHSEHGVAQYLGLREIAGGENQGDYMVLEYSAGAKLYVPLTRMDLVQRFRGGGEAKPALDRMGGATWTRTKGKIKAKMRDMADELLKLYATRKMADGFNYSSDSNWQREFEDAFEFTPTRDQLTAIAEIKRDMESIQPMDRLLCGDVGYGKTEVVMRAAFKALGDGKQVVVLAPTTVLAFQHFETFKRRFQPFPVRVEMFSRFRTPKEIKAGLSRVGRRWKIDIAIGTHRLLSQDVVYPRSGPWSWWTKSSVSGSNTRNG